MAVCVAQQKAGDPWSDCLPLQKGPKMSSMVNLFVGRGRSQNPKKGARKRSQFWDRPLQSTKGEGAKKRPPFLSGRRPVALENVQKKQVVSGRKARLGKMEETRRTTPRKPWRDLLMTLAAARNQTSRSSPQDAATQCLQGWSTFVACFRRP